MSQNKSDQNSVSFLNDEVSHTYQQQYLPPAYVFILSDLFK
jgi:hypothetical protein